MNGKKTFKNMDFYLFSIIHKIIFLLLVLTIVAQPQQDTIQLQFPPKQNSIEKRIYRGNQILKAGLITAIVGSFFLTMSALVIFIEPTNNKSDTYSPGHDDTSLKNGVLLGGVGIINCGISIPLTISGAAIKRHFKSMKNKGKKNK